MKFKIVKLYLMDASVYWTAFSFQTALRSLRHSVPLVLLRLGVCCCLHRDVERGMAREGSWEVEEGTTKLHWACVQSDSSSQRCFLLLAECYIALSHCYKVFISSQLSLNFNIVYWDLVYFYCIIILSFLPKGRAFTANAGTNLHFCPKAGLPLQMQEPKLQFY